MGTYTEDRPWGRFEQFCHNQECTVKIITVKPNSKLSLQYHKQREEFWRVIDGRGHIVVGDKTFDAKAGDEFFIKKIQKHRMMTTDSEMRVLEVSFGHFDEDDIVRLEDEYKRS
jgi:mannose-6-phosphate isomerase-like protein (cupin superfamily)